MPKSNFAPLADRIRRARRDAGLTQQALADRLGVSLRAVQAWEAGAEPQLAKRAALARVTGKPIAYFADVYDEEEAVA